jgi:hypothetical protein
MAYSAGVHSISNHQDHPRHEVRQKKTKLRNWKIVEWFRQANTRVIKALRDHLLPKKAEKGGPKTRSSGSLYDDRRRSLFGGGNEQHISHLFGPGTIVLNGLDLIFGQGTQFQPK